MNDAAIFEATVPVFQHYLQCVKLLLTKLSAEHEPLLEERLATHAFTASEHLQTAIGFIPRTVLPLLGQEASDSKNEALCRDDLVRLVDEAGTLLRTVTLEDLLARETSTDNTATRLTFIFSWLKEQRCGRLNPQPSIK